MQNFFKILAYFVTIVYFLLGSYMFIQEKYRIIVDPTYAKIFGFSLIMYSIYRGYTIYRKFKDIEDDSE
ncbi:MAG TPA: hypothetical protein PK887_02830 [Ignavibacteriales bacterium]|nr:hypothetical protein [Ignavibacteriales bacterium]